MAVEAVPGRTDVLGARLGLQEASELQSPGVVSRNLVVALGLGAHDFESMQTGTSGQIEVRDDTVEQYRQGGALSFSGREGSNSLEAVSRVVGHPIQKIVHLTLGLAVLWSTGASGWCQSLEESPRTQSSDPLVGLVLDLSP